MSDKLKYPCDTCVYNPPSSCDGKPCGMCDPNDIYPNCYEEKETEDEPLR